MKLINTDDIKYQMLYKENFLSGTGVEAQAVWKSDIDAMPAVDAVCVVRCKDCKWYDMSKCMVTTEMGHHYVCQVHSYRPVPEDYCSQGERKDNE